MAEKREMEERVAEAKRFFDTYRKEIGQSIREDKRVIQIDFNDLASFSHQLADELINSPEEIFQILETALDDLGLIKNARVRLLNIPETQHSKIGHIRAKHLNRMLSIEGIVRQASDVRPQVVVAKFECPTCGTIISVLQIEKKFREPSKCSCGRKGQFTLKSKEMVDAQRLVIEESPESLSGGEQPRRMAVFLQEDLVEPRMEEKTTPGSRVRVIGILKEIPVPLQTGSISTRFDLAIEANNIIPLEETYEEVKISDEDERQIQELAADPKVFNKLSASIAPSIWGYDEIKKALVLQMFGGCRKVGKDHSVKRGDIHVLLIGDPGVAKSIGKNEKVMYISNKETGYDTIEHIHAKFKRFPKNLKVLTLDMISQEPKWDDVEEIIKHLPEKDLIQVKTNHGKQIIATKDHSFITLSKSGEIVSIKGEELTKNTYLPIPINYHKEKFKYFNSNFFNKKTSTSKILPDKIKLDYNFGFFIGIFLSEGYIKNNKTIEISNQNKEIQKKVVNFSKKMSLNYNQQDNKVSIFSKNLSDILKTHCYDKNHLEALKRGIKGNFSRIKKMPEFAFFSPKEFIYGLISGLFSGDGRLIQDKKTLKGFELITTSKQLAENTSDLLFSIGILNKIKKRNYIYKNQETDYYSLSIPTPMIAAFLKDMEIIGRKISSYNNHPIYSYNNQIPCGDLIYEIVKKLGYNKRIGGNRTLAAEMRTVKKRNEIGRLRLLRLIKEFEKTAKQPIPELETLKKIANSNIIWSKINHIEILEKKNEEVYDLSIPSTNTFVANGIGVHNSVTLKFISEMAPKGRYIVGKAASGAGITATVVKDEFLKGWALEAGAMVLANKGIVCIDEIEKMDPNDRSAMHEALEQQCMLPDFKLMLSNGEYVKIGEYVDNLIENNKDKVIFGKDCEILETNNTELLSTDFTNHFPVRASKVSRHIAPKEFIRIKLTNGREITVTPEHPCWVVKKGKIKIIPAEKLTNSDYFPTPSYLKVREKEYKKENDILCKILGYHISDGCYELNRGKKNGIQFWNNNETLIEDYKQAVESFFGIKAGITKRKHQFAVRVISKKVADYMKNLDPLLLEKGILKKIPDKVMAFPKENVKYLLRALFDGDGTVVLEKRNGCRVSLSTENLNITEQVVDLLLRFGITSSIFRDKNTWKVDISGQENLKKYLLDISFLSEHKKRRLKEYIEKEKTYKTIRDIIPGCTDKISEIFKKLNISMNKEVGHSIDLHVEKQRLFLQKLVLIAEKYAINKNNKEIIAEINELKKLAFGYSRWNKIKEVSKIKNDDIKWVYDVTIEPYHTFISNGMVLHNTVTISKANVQASLQAQTSVLAAGNPKLGRFEPFQTIAQQIDLPPSLINRFDVIFVLRDMPDKFRDESIASHVLAQYQKDDRVTPVERDLFRKYVAHAKQKIKPILTDEAVKEIREFYVRMRNAPAHADSAGIRSIPISARQLEALVRLSEAHAKMRLSKKVTKEDAKIAIEIIKYYMMQVGYDPETKSFDIDRIAIGVSTSQRSKVILLRETISKLEERLGKFIPLEELEKELIGKMTREEIDDAIQKLRASGDIFEPRKGFVQKV